MAIGRVGSTMLSRRLLDNIQKQMAQNEKLFEQISSNKKILRPSDDPVGTGKAMNLRDKLSRMEAYEKQITSAEVWTNLTHSALEGANRTWKRVNEIAVKAAGTEVDADFDGMVEELEQMLQALVQTANQMHNGNYLFAGNKTDTPPFRAETDPNTGKVTGVFYDGDDGIRQVKTHDSRHTQINILGSNGGAPDQPGAFVDSNLGINLFQTVIDLRDKLQNHDNGGISGPGGLIEEIESGAQSVIGAQVRLGGAQEVLQLDKNQLIEEKASVGGFLSDIENADMTQLILDLNNAQNTYEAALAAGGRILQRGLLNFL